MIEKISKLDYNIIKWLEENFRNNFFGLFFKLITQLGDKEIFILIVMVLFWVVDKKFGYKFLFTFIGSAFVNQVLKVIVARPRPYLEGIESFGPKSDGFSFPSGHAQSTSVIYYSFDQKYGKKNKLVRGILIALLVLIPFSRMYLAQHYLTDVLVGLIIGLFVAYLMFKLFDLMGEKEHFYPLFATPIILIVLAFLLNKDYNSYKELFIVGAGFIGFSSGYAIEKLYIKHNVETSFKNKILKLLIGGAVVAIFYLGLSFIFKAIISESLILDFLRYLIVALTATTLVPFIFTKVFKE